VTTILNNIAIVQVTVRPHVRREEIFYEHEEGVPKDLISRWEILRSGPTLTAIIHIEEELERSSISTRVRLLKFL
jgi:hypothetical protein